MAAAAMLLTTACSNDDAANGVALDSQTTAANLAVGFDTYTANATRAVQKGVMNTTTLQSTGFGVFAQQSDNGDYSTSTDPNTNFMWNQEVTFDAPSWIYSPLKYWPNETVSDMHDAAGHASSTSTDKLSFFAYAPYVAQQTDDYSGKLTGVVYSAAPAIDNAKNTGSEEGILAVISNNDKTNDPWVRYQVAAKPSNSVDLLWGVAPAGGLHYTDVHNTSVTVGEGLPLLNLTKPSKDQKMKFLFKHALARIGLSVVAAVNQIAPGGAINDQTKIAIKSVTIEETTDPKVLATVGSLNLNNTAANQSRWTNTSGNINFTINNTVGGELNPNLAYNTDKATTWTQTSPWTGVTTTEQNIIADNKYFMVIPGHASTTLKVTITYNVITKDDKVGGGYTETQNTIWKEVTINPLTNNKAYNLKLILGLTSVKLDAEVADWQLEGDTDVDLPRNQE